jgi:hypothetical protein
VKANRRYAILGFLAWQLLKRQAARRARRAAHLDEGGRGPWLGRGVVLVGMAAAAAGALFWWRSRGGSAEPAWEAQPSVRT